MGSTLDKASGHRQRSYWQNQAGSRLGGWIGQNSKEEGAAQELKGHAQQGRRGC